MVARQQIQELCRRIVDAFHLERIILFGSYAYGVPEPDSDVDLLVILPFEGKPAHKGGGDPGGHEPEVSCRRHWSHTSGADRRISTNDFFLREVIGRGQVLREAAHGWSGSPRPRAISQP
jgi:predicted nucleotidyltransferase